jgi:signal transduction histidine kinase/DNA-binding response OmpR family regulator
MSIPTRGNILIVDDQPENLQVLAAILTRHGYRVRPAIDGRLALKAAQTSPPDLILLDVMMPDLDGYQVCERLQVDRRTRDIPIIFLSALDETHGKVKAFAAGAVDYVTKPFQVEEILARVGTHLAVQDLQKSLQQRNVQMAQEIAERKRAQKNLQRRNQELNQLNRWGQELTATLDLQQVTKHLLKAATETIGAQGASIWLWDEEVDDCLVCRAVTDRGQDQSPVNLRLRAGQGVAGWVAKSGESIVVHKVSDDPRFYSGIDKHTGVHTLSLIAVPLRTHNGLLGVLEVINKLESDFDEDDLALAETLAASAAIAADNARLVDALHQRTEELEVRNAELDAFAHTVAHDLKNPLAQIVGFADLLRQTFVTMAEKEIGSLLGIITRSGRKMSSIINELLLLSSVRQMEEIATSALDMASIVTQVQERLGSMIQSYEAELVLPKAWPVALGYGPWVEEVWANYMSNAIKYGGQPPRVELGATENGQGKVRFWIRDNGLGLTAEEQERLFTPFTRLDQVRVEGQGLGLSIVRRIAQKLGGQVGVESKVGEGSVFWFSLPADGV